MKTETQIAKENVERLKRRKIDSRWEKCHEHLQSCQRFKEFLEEEKICYQCHTIPYGDGNCHCGKNDFGEFQKKVIDLQNAIKTYTFDLEWWNWKRILENGSRDLVYDKESVKQKIQEAQKELKEDIEEQRKELKDLYDMLRPKGKDSDSVRICLLTEKMNLLQIQKKKIDKVFLNKFGEKLK